MVTQINFYVNRFYRTYRRNLSYRHLYRISMTAGMIDACRKIYKVEGVSGLYRGFWISSIQIVSGVFYVSTYEGVRHLLRQDTPLGCVDSKVKALIAGGAASLVGQTIVVPFDVLSQHLMVLGINSTKHGRVYVDKVGRTKFYSFNSIRSRY